MLRQVLVVKNKLRPSLVSRRSLCTPIKRPETYEPDLEDKKSLMQKHAEKKEEWTPWENEDQEKLTNREAKILADKKRLKWRKTFDDDERLWRSKLGAFNTNEQDMTWMMWMQQPWNLTPSAIKETYKKKQLEKEAFLQQYIEDRVRLLGTDLATAHFICHREGKIKFVGDSVWKTKDDYEQLPKKFHPAYKVEAINFDNLPLHYEGVENIRELSECTSISLRNSPYFDDWCLDRLSGNMLPKLEILDLRGSKVTFNGMTALYRLPSLKKLYIDKHETTNWKLVCVMLEEINPNLEIIFEEGT